MHPDGFPVPQERDFYWKNIMLSFKKPATDRIDLLQKSEKTLKPSASISVYLPDICGCSMTRRFLQEI
jgi:hypothetical protein